MAGSLLDRQLARARRRLFLSILLAALAWGWLSALLTVLAWFLVQPYLLTEPAPSLRWIVAGSLLGLGTALALILAFRRRPTAGHTALELDARFDLKERVTTALALSSADHDSPAGKALLADVDSHLTPVRVGQRFPVALPRLPASLMGVATLALVLVALYWSPRVGGGDNPEEEGLAASPALAQDLEQSMKKLAASRPSPKQPDPVAKPEDLDRIDAEIEKFTRRPRDTREEVRDRIKDATALEDQIRREQKEQSDRVDAFKEAMKQLDRLKRKDPQKKQDGPAQKAADALARGDMAGTRDEMQRLAEKLEKEEEKERLRRKRKDPQASDEEKEQAEEELKRLERKQGITEEERKKLAQQVAEMEDDLKRLSRSKEEREKELRDLADKGELNKEELDRELEKMEELSKEDRKALEEMAKELGECKQCIKEGQCKEAAGKLAKAGKKAGELGKEGAEAALARKMVQVQAVKRALCRALDGQAGQASGRRPETKDDSTKSKDALVPGECDRGKLEVVGQGPVGGFKGPRKPEQMQQEIRQAAQEAPAAIDRQRLPPAARKMARGYFEKVRGSEKSDQKKK